MDRKQATRATSRSRRSERAMGAGGRRRPLRDVALAARRDNGESPPPQAQIKQWRVITTKAQTKYIFSVCVSALSIGVRMAAVFAIRIKKKGKKRRPKKHRTWAGTVFAFDSINARSNRLGALPHIPQSTCRSCGLEVDRDKSSRSAVAASCAPPPRPRRRTIPPPPPSNGRIAHFLPIMSNHSPQASHEWNTTLL